MEESVSSLQQPIERYWFMFHYPESFRTDNEWALLRDVGNDVIAELFDGSDLNDDTLSWVTTNTIEYGGEEIESYPSEFVDSTVALVKEAFSLPINQSWLMMLKNNVGRWDDLRPMFSNDHFTLYTVLKND